MSLDIDTSGPRASLRHDTISRVVLLSIAAIHLDIVLPTAAGCECAPPRPPCAYWGIETIFLGTVTGPATANGDMHLVRMHIDKAYKGVSEKTVVLYDDGMCNGPDLQIGEQYLMYTEDNGMGYLPARGCTRSRSVREAKEDLEFLDGIPQSPPTSTVFGQVTVRSGAMHTHTEGESAPGVTVEIQGEGAARRSITDGQGRYSFSGLKPGEYMVKASLSGFSQSDSEGSEPVEVIAHGCDVLDVVLRKDWNGTLGGHITKADGSPGPAGIQVDLIRVSTGSQDRRSELLIGFRVQTDEQGQYAFRGVAPGFYKVVLNLSRDARR